MISIRVEDRTFPCAPGASLLSVLLANGIVVSTACGGRGVCHLCRVTVQAGKDSLPPPNAIEKRALGNILLAKGMRLSCQIMPTAELTVDIPKVESAEERAQRLSRARRPPSQ